MATETHLPTNQDWLDLFDEGELVKRRSDAEVKFRDLTSDQINHLRRRAKSDLFFLTSGILEFDLLSERLHGDLCYWLEETRDERYRIQLLPRGHYKTTIASIAESVQIALPNSDQFGKVIVPEHPWCLGPNSKVLIQHETGEGASRVLYEIASSFTRRPLMLALFPECVPTKAQRKNKTELELPRTEPWKEPTFDALGIGGAEQGRHYHRVKMDDIIGKEARDSATVMQSVKTSFDNIKSLMTRMKIDGWDLTGTRWSMDDVYAHAFEQYGLRLERSVLKAIDANRERLPSGIAVAYIRSAIEDGVPIFPEEFSEEDLAQIRKNKKIWAAQYANNPLDAELTEFHPDWLKFYNIAQNGDLIVFEGEKGSTRIRPRTLDRVILVDPSMGEDDDADETGIVVTGTDWRNNIYVLETIKERLKPPQFIKKLMELYMKYWPRLVSIEKVNFSGIFHHWYKLECQRLKLWPNIYPYSPGSKRSKFARVKGLANYGAAGQLYCLEGMYDLRDEWERFGSIRKYHLLDALAQGQEVWQPGLRSEDKEHEKKAYDIISNVEEERSIVTGY